MGTPGRIHAGVLAAWFGAGLLCGLAVQRTAFSITPPASLGERRAALGRHLFEDPRLSADGAVRCASCHIPEKSYMDGRRVAVGVYGRVGTRNTPSLLDVEVIRGAAFFWEGRRAALVEAVLDPVTNPMEMGLPDASELVQRLKHDPFYSHAFSLAFPGEGPYITPAHAAKALADYLRSLKPPPSAYDRYAVGGDRNALGSRALLGLALFKGKGRCAECHRIEGNPPALTDHLYHRTGVGMDAIVARLPTLTEAVIDRSLQGGDVGNRIATHADEAQLGRFNVTRDPADIGLFRTPSLRGVASTAPYMHDGSVATLDEALDREIYYRSLQAGQPLQLTVEEREELKAFLQSL